MNPWMEFTNAWLLRTSVEGSVLILTVLGLSWTLGRHLGPRWRVVLWTLVGLKLVVPAFVEVTPGLGNWFRPAPAMAEVASAEASDSVLETDPFVPGEEFDLFADAVPSGESSSVSIGAMLFAIWLVGAVVFATALVWGQRRYAARSGLVPCRDARLLGMVRSVARGLEVRQDFRVLLGPEGATPAVCGALGGDLVLPRDWQSRFEPEVLRYILMHEIEHIRHRDVLLNWIAAAVNAVHWFNPLVWIAVSRFQADREMRCDANTLSRLQPAERFDYGRTLLRVQREFLPAPAIAGVAPCVRNHPTLQQRILMITNPTQRKRWLNAILAPGIAGLIAISFGSATADEERPSSREGEKPREGSPREGERESGSARDGDRPKEGEREGERPKGSEGERPREGDRPREGEGERPRGSEGEREGERPMSREGEGERGREGGPRDGGPREGGPKDGGPTHREGEIRVVIHRDGVMFGDRKVEMVNLRGELDKVQARSAILFAQPDVTFQQVSTVTNALRNSGIHDVRIGGIEGQPGPGQPGPGRPGEAGRPPFPGGPRDGEGGPRPEGGPRDGEMRRPEGARPEGGPRDGDRPRPEGARDGDRPKTEGARDGEGSRPEGGPRDGDRPRPEGTRDGERPKPEGARDGEGSRPEGGPRDGDKPRSEGGPRDGDRPKAEGEG